MLPRGVVKTDDQAGQGWERQFVRALGDEISVTRPKYPANSSFGGG